MAISSIPGTTFTILTTLAQASQTAIQLATQVESDQATSQIERELKQKIAALPNNADNTLLQVSEAQLKRARTTFNTLSQRSAQFGVNGNVLTSINNELAALQTDATNGDSANFDRSLAVIYSNIGNLVVIPPTAPFQPDQILGLKTNGLAVQTSSAYNLSTTSGKAAAHTDLSNAQAFINQLLTLTTSNQVVAGTLATALSNQIDSLNSTIQQTQANSQIDVDLQTAQLTQLAHNQEHIIQLNLGNATELSSELAKASTIVNPPKSPFAVLQNAVGATPDTSTPADSSQAILSLLV